MSSLFRLFNRVASSVRELFADDLTESAHADAVPASDADAHSGESGYYD